MTPADMSDYESDDVGDLIVKRPRWRKAEETEALMELDKNILPRDHWALACLQREDNLSALKTAKTVLFNFFLILIIL